MLCKPLFFNRTSCGVGNPGMDGRCFLDQAGIGGFSSLEVPVSPNIGRSRPINIRWKPGRHRPVAELSFLPGLGISSDCNCVAPNPDRRIHYPVGYNPRRLEPDHHVRSRSPFLRGILGNVELLQFGQMGIQRSLCSWGSNL